MKQQTIVVIVLKLNVQSMEQTQRYTRHSLVKKYVEGETKEQRKVRKELEKAQKSAEVPKISPRNTVEKHHVLCLKHGKKYSAEYVNKLYSMVKRHCKLDFEFVCLTDDPTDIAKEIKIIPLPKNVSGWWCKPYMFSKDIPLRGKILYMDLDVVIARNIDHLFLYEIDSWCVIRDFTRKMRPSWQKYNSSVIRFNSGQLTHFWEDFEIDQENIQRRFHGDQDWLYDVAQRTHTKAKLFPDNWILSWKWEIRRDKTFKAGSRSGSRQLRTIEQVVPPNECCITVFHGDPNPENCFDPWVVNNWK